MGNPFSHLNDYKLMELYKDGDDMAFEVIYSRHKDKVYSYLNKRIADKNLVDDIFQGIFTKFHKSRHLYRNEYPLIKWIYTISRSELLDTVKKKKVNLITLKDEHTKIDNKNTEDIIEFENEKTLKQNEKEDYRLRYYSEEDFLEISKTLNLSEANTRKIISRGIKKLKLKYLGKRHV